MRRPGFFDGSHEPIEGGPGERRLGLQSITERGERIDVRSALDEKQLVQRRTSRPFDGTGVRDGVIRGCDEGIERAGDRDERPAEIPAVSEARDRRNRAKRRSLELIS